MSSAPSAPLTTQGLLRGGGPPTAPPTHPPWTPPPLRKTLGGGQGCIAREGTSKEAPEAVGGGYCRLQMPLSLALAARETVAGHRLGALEAGGGGGDPPLSMHPWWGGGVRGGVNFAREISCLKVTPKFPTQIPGVPA